LTKLIDIRKSKYVAAY